MTTLLALLGSITLLFGGYLLLIKVIRGIFSPTDYYDYDDIEEEDNLPQCQDFSFSQSGRRRLKIEYYRDGSIRSQEAEEQFSTSNSNKKAS